MDQTLLVIHLRGLWFICDPQIVAPNGDQSIYKELHHYESVAHTVQCPYMEGRGAVMIRVHTVEYCF